MTERNLVLWADVPLSQRRSGPDDAFYGCPYAVRLQWWEADRRGGDGYRRCGGAPYRGTATCWIHQSSDPRDHAANVDARVRGAMLRGVGLEYGKTIASFRRMSDKDVRNLHNVGAKLAIKIREIRDTWTDEQIADFTGIPVSRIRPSAPPPPCTSAHGALSWVGG